MKKIILIAVFLVLTPHVFAQQSEHVIIISVDGFRPDFYLDSSWGMVNLRQMMKEGVSAKSVNSMFPTVTFVNHTTIITGENPAEHGILYNSPFAPKGQNSDWYWFAKDIKARTLWDATKENGMVTAAVNWPVSVGGAIDYNIPIIKEKGKSQLEVIKNYSNPVGFFDEVQMNATGKLSSQDFIVQHDLTTMDANVGRISSYILREYKPNLLTLRLSSVDHFQHRDGREGQMVRTAVAGVDRVIREIQEGLERAGITEKSTIIVTGDHGFINTHTTIAPNIWLKEAGLFTDVDYWKAQFHTVGGSAFLMLNEKKGEKTSETVKKILRSLPDGQKKLFEIVERSTLDSLGVDSQPVFALKAMPGIVFKNNDSGSLIGTHRRGTHGYYPDLPQMKTGFVAFGAGLKKDFVIDNMGLEDIAPLVAKLLGFDFKPKSGILLKGLLLNED